MHSNLIIITIVIDIKSESSGFFFMYAQIPNKYFVIIVTSDSPLVDSSISQSFWEKLLLLSVHLHGKINNPTPM